MLKHLIFRKLVSCKMIRTTYNPAQANVMPKVTRKKAIPDLSNTRVTCNFEATTGINSAKGS